MAHRIRIAAMSLWGALFNNYRPERHYMRGPGPKWRTKHCIDVRSRPVLCSCRAFYRAITSKTGAFEQLFGARQQDKSGDIQSTRRAGGSPAKCELTKTHKIRAAILRLIALAPVHRLRT
jgi:hypothetical protein